MEPNICPKAYFPPRKYRWSLFYFHLSAITPNNIRLAGFQFFLSTLYWRREKQLQRPWSSCFTLTGDFNEVSKYFESISFNAKIVTWFHLSHSLSLSLPHLSFPLSLSLSLMKLARPCKPLHRIRNKTCCTTSFFLICKNVFWLVWKFKCAKRQEDFGYLNTF